MLNKENSKSCTAHLLHDRANTFKIINLPPTKIIIKIAVSFTLNNRNNNNINSSNSNTMQTIINNSLSIITKDNNKATLIYLAQLASSARCP